mmetsp:Transcript_19903/g.64789  ORF Transcript_19903/g.64789 Transcript_19903/m.64789 type:complete len:275 (-) Transcript_19903:32-856(-)
MRSDGAGEGKKRTEREDVVVSARHPEWDLPPLPELELTPHTVLEEVESRETCEECGRSCKWLCFACARPLVSFPNVELPCTLHVLRGPQERATAATGVHLKVLAPDRVNLVFSASDLNSLDSSTTCLLFPGEDSISVEEAASSRASDHGERGLILQNAILLDEKWTAVKSFWAANPSLRRFPCVRLDPGTRTAFYRFHTKGVEEGALSTAEAAMYFCREVHRAQGRHAEGEKCRCFDDLLWLFVWMRRQVEGRMERQRSKRAKTTQECEEERQR